MSEPDGHASSEKSQSWWQTIPGMLTALAAVISAIAGLIVALNQGRATGETPAAPPAEQAVRHEPAPPGRTASAPARDLSPPAGMDVKLSGGKLVLRILSAHLEPFNADTRMLTLDIRFTNNDNTWVRNYYWTLRLIVDDVPRAHEDVRYEQVEAHSAKEIPYAFKVPTSGGRVVLRISNDAGEQAEIPFDLPAS